jgi:hypothetical protein
VAQLLNEWCLLCGVHPVTAAQRKIFHFAAWCSNPGDIPPEIDLEIPEPEVPAGRDDRERPYLRYPVLISVKLLGDQAPLDDGHAPHPSPTDNDHRQRGQHYRRLSAYFPTPVGHNGDGSGRPGAQRTPMHSQLGPPAVGCQDTSRGVALGAVRIIASLVP